MSAENQCSRENPCTAVALLIQGQIDSDGRMDKMEQLIESMRNRLPLWATLVITLLSTGFGIAVSHIK